MILRRILAAVALLCAFAAPSYAQTGRALSAAQLNSEINQLFIDQTNGAITPFGLRQVTLDMVASGIIGSVTLTGDVGGTGINTIPTTIGPTVAGTATFTMLQTFSGGITGLPSPVNPSDAAPKSYVDNVAAGIIVLPQTALATTTVLPNSPTYSNGSSGVGATLTAGTNSTLTVDGTVAVLNTVVLVKNQSSAFQNGIYTVTTAGSGSAAWVLTRATYFDQSTEMKAGSYTLVTGGTANANSSYTLQTSVATVGTSSVTWLLFSQGSPGVASGGAVIASRALAAALNLSIYTTITTQGYANPGDGGGASFKNVGTSPFIDTGISSGTITAAGTGCTNGIYSGVALTGGTGSLAIATITVSGTVVTAVTITGTGGNGYTVGDVLSASSATIGCSNFHWTVATITSPNGSFTDSAGTHFQIVPNGPINTRQFGAAINYTEAGGDAGATNDQGPTQAALRYAAAGNGTTDAGGTSGAIVMVPSGGSLICNGLQVPAGVIFTGSSQTGALLKECDSDGIGFSFITLGDPQSHQTAFFPAIQNMTLFGSGNGTTATGMAMVYSRSAQNGEAIKNVAIYSTNRMCVKYEIGDGGTGMFGIHNTYCVPNGVTSPQVAFDLSGSLGFEIDDGTFISVGGSLWSGTGFAIGNSGGTTKFDGVHCENMTTCISYDGSLSAPALLDVRNGIGNGLLTNFVVIKTGSVPGNVLISTFAANGTSCSVIKAGSCVATGKIVGPTAF